MTQRGLWSWAPTSPEPKKRGPKPKPRKPGKCINCGKPTACNRSPRPNKTCSKECHAAIVSQKFGKPRVWICSICRRVVKDRRTGQSRTTCSEQCLAEFRKHQTIETARRKQKWFTCERCYELFKNQRNPKCSNRYCSRACAYAVKAEQKRKRLEFKERWGCWPGEFSRIGTGICGSCGKQFVSRRARNYCSDECRASSRRRPRTQKACLECGITFAGSPGIKFCSARCCRRSGNRNASHRRRKREKASTNREVIRLYVLANRDGWTCQICGQRVNRLSVGWPDGPSVDHIVPLSKGGEHNYVNVRLAHVRCNTLRGAP